MCQSHVEQDMLDDLVEDWMFGDARLIFLLRVEAERIIEASKKVGWTKREYTKARAQRDHAAVESTS